MTRWELRDHLVQAVQHVSKLEMQREPDRVRSIVRSHLRTKLADFIAREKVEERELEACTEFRLELVVVSPNDFFRMVEEEVYRQQRFIGRPL